MRIQKDLAFTALIVAMGLVSGFPVLSIASAPNASAQAEPVIVNVENFVRAETAAQFDRVMTNAGGVNRFFHLRELVCKREASSTAIGGNSAGGNLALVSVLKMKELKLPSPAVVVASTPWSDLDETGDSYFTNEGIDRMLVTEEGLLAAAAKLYANGADLKQPLISPVYADFAGFPPTILFTGTRDLFLSGTVGTHRSMREAGVDAELHVFEGMSHGGWMLQDFPESRAFTSEVAVFLKRHMK